MKRSTARVVTRTLRRLRASIVLGALCVTSSLAGAGCVAGAPTTPARGVVVSGPPPAPLIEARSPPPTPSAAWVAGYWHWNGATYAWIPGHWENAPPGMIWYGPTYGPTADGRYLYEPGTFRPADGPPSNPGPLPANRPTATANAFH